VASDPAIQGLHVSDSGHQLIQLRAAILSNRACLIYRGGCVGVTASANVLTKAVALGQLPLLISINRGGFLTMPASINVLTQARLISINRGGFVTMPASINTLTKAVALGQPLRIIRINSLHCPPRLSINRGGCWPSCPASNNRGGQPGRPPQSPIWKHLTKLVQLAGKTADTDADADSL
jgi:hypothetical protein